jgi:hypothetical protein
MNTRRKEKETNVFLYICSKKKKEAKKISVVLLTTREN